MSIPFGLQDVVVPIWLGCVMALGMTTWLSALKFLAMHSRRYELFMSVGERFNLFLTNPKEYFKTNLSDQQAGSRAFFARVDDPAIERIRLRTIRFAVATGAAAIIGLPAMFVVVGVVRRLPSIGAGEWLIMLSWVILLIIAFQRRAQRRVKLMFALALVGHCRRQLSDGTDIVRYRLECQAAASFPPCYASRTKRRTARQFGRCRRPLAGFCYASRAKRRKGWRVRARSGPSAVPWYASRNTSGGEYRTLRQ
jgi:hypothetical protein